MERKIIPAWSFVKKSYDIFRNHVGLLIAVTIIQLAVNIGMNAFIESQSGLISFILSIVSFFVSLLMSLGLLKISLLIIDNKDATIGDLFGQASKLWDGFVLYILYSLILLIPTLLIMASFVLPAVFVFISTAGGGPIPAGGTAILSFLGIIFGIAGSISLVILSIKYSQAFYLLVDKDLKPVAAMKESGTLMKGAKWEYFVAGIVLFLVNLLGLLALVVGLLVSLPVTLLASAMIYRLIANGSSNTATLTAVEPQ